MVAMIAAAEGGQREPYVVACLSRMRKSRLAAEQVAEGVDRPGEMAHHEHASHAAPQETHERAARPACDKTDQCRYRQTEQAPPQIGAMQGDGARALPQILHVTRGDCHRGVLGTE